MPVANLDWHKHKNKTSLQTNRKTDYCYVVAMHDKTNKTVAYLLECVDLKLST